MPKKSTGILWYRFQNKAMEVFLVHPGGPFWRNKNDSTWSIPKGEFEEGEDPLHAAKREMQEETGINADATGLRTSEFIELNPVRQKSGKIVYAWAAKGDFNTSELTSNLFELEWPPKSGKKATFPEVDKGEWFTIKEAKKRILSYQLPLITQLEELV
ncbi:MAG TPA: NUDIX domain-containing protein [Hanamia sp.]|jgi:predicted NUDIX family NTP pyrophosphohydrolase|nr:NUDIX domain-containing protein [Hanamia sp.]